MRTYVISKRNFIFHKSCEIFAHHFNRPYFKEPFHDDATSYSSTRNFRREKKSSSNETLSFDIIFIYVCIVNIEYFSPANSSHRALFCIIKHVYVLALFFHPRLHNVSYTQPRIPRRKSFDFRRHKIEEGKKRIVRLAIVSKLLVEKVL